MELRQLESFVAVAEELHFGRAARRVHLSQPALSQQIMRLEHDIGVQLLSRTQRTVRLTPAGQEFLDDVRRLLGDVRAAVVRAERIAGGRTGSLRVGFVGAALYSVVPPFLRALRDRLPDVEVALTEQKTADQLAGLRHDRLDLGFVHRPDNDLDGIEQTDVFHESVAIALPDDHPQVDTDRVPLDALADDAFVLFPRALEPDTYDRFVTLCAAAGFVPDVRQEATSLQTVLGLVASGLGVAFVAASVTTGLSRRGVVFRPLEPAPRLVTTIARATANDNPAIEAALSLATATMPRSTADLAGPV